MFSGPTSIPAGGADAALTSSRLHPAANAASAVSAMSGKRRVERVVKFMAGCLRDVQVGSPDRRRIVVSRVAAVVVAAVAAVVVAAPPRMLRRRARLLPLRLPEAASLSRAPNARGQRHNCAPRAPGSRRPARAAAAIA